MITIIEDTCYCNLCVCVCVFFFFFGSDVVCVYCLFAEQVWIFFFFFYYNSRNFVIKSFPYGVLDS